MTGSNPWFGPIIFGVVSLLVILATRTPLAYDPTRAPDAPQPAT